MFTLGVHRFVMIFRIFCSLFEWGRCEANEKEEETTTPKLKDSHTNIVSTVYKWQSCSTMAGLVLQLLRIYGFMNVKISESLHSQHYVSCSSSPSFPTDSVHVFASSSVCVCSVYTFKSNTHKQFVWCNEKKLSAVVLLLFYFWAELLSLFDWAMGFSLYFVVVFIDHEQYSTQ